MRVAVFVDAGFLFISGGRSLLDDQAAGRGDLYLDIPSFVRHCRDFAERVTGSDLLRVYWYDGANGAPSSLQKSVGTENFVKLRLGLVNNFNQQKGVDSLLVTDMINLARNKAIDSAVLVSGDADMRVGVQHAQEFGVHVHLVGVEQLVPLIIL